MPEQDKMHWGLGGLFTAFGDSIVGFICHFPVMLSPDLAECRLLPSAVLRVPHVLRLLVVGGFPDSGQDIVAFPVKHKENKT